MRVLGPASSDLVVVYKGVERESYSCAPECENRLTLGNSTAYFSRHLVADRHPRRSGAIRRRRQRALSGVGCLIRLV